MTRVSETPPAFAGEVISNPTTISTSVFAATMADIEQEISTGIPEIPLPLLHKVFQRIAREHGILLA